MKHRRPRSKYDPSTLKIEFTDEIFETVYAQEKRSTPYPYMNKVFYNSVCEKLKEYGIHDAKYCITCSTVKRESEFYTPASVTCIKCMRHINRNLFGGHWSDAVESTGAKCAVCGDYFTDVHHVIPRSYGGADELNNLVPLCKNCHHEAHRGFKKADKYKFNKTMLSILVSLGYASKYQDKLTEILMGT